MINNRPVIGITMGDPVGIGPEIILSALSSKHIYDICRPLVIGDVNILKSATKIANAPLSIAPVPDHASGTYTHGRMDVLNISNLNAENTQWGRPTPETGKAMVDYITTAIDMALEGKINGVVTGPINKHAMQAAGFAYSGHTELLAERTRTKQVAMMLTGEKLRVVLVTIHIPLKDIFKTLSPERIHDKIAMTFSALRDRFGIASPRIAVAGLNPHAGENGLFGNEEKDIITPAIRRSKKQGIHVSGPYPPDTVFYQAMKGHFDAVVCMYHDQGLIPFKLLHFSDGVNTTLGLPIIRTSVDHGTAYEIAGTGRADSGSLIAAIQMAARHAISVGG